VTAEIVCQAEPIIEMIDKGGVFIVDETSAGSDKKIVGKK